MTVGHNTISDKRAVAARCVLSTILLAALLLCTTLRVFGQGNTNPATVGETIFADFESGTYDGWTLSGNCWTTDAFSDHYFPGKITGFRGNYFLCTLHPRRGSNATGKAVSQEFVIEKPFINFLIGGGNHPNEACINLVIDGKIVRSETGDGSSTLRTVSWNVALLKGSRAHLEVVDVSTSTERGYVMVDDIRFGDARAVSDRDAACDSVDFNEQYDHFKPDPQFQQSVQDLVQGIVSQYHVVGATVVCAVDGKLVAAVAVGKRKLGSGVPIEVTDPMHIGSNTKGMTALVFARLVEQGKIDWSITPAGVFPSSREKIDPDFARVPMIEFLRQRSGCRPDWPEYGAYAPLPERQGRLQYALDCLAARPNYSPASKHVYSNSNYIILGAVEEKIADTSWPDLMRSEVFGPLHMRQAGFGAMGNKDDISAPWQHPLQNGRLVPVFGDNPPFHGPAGTVHCSALDLANYAYRQATGSFGLGSYLSPATWSILHTPGQGSGYACGVAVGGVGPKGVRDMGHGGSNNMSCSNWSVTDQGRVIIVAMLNCATPGLQETMDQVKVLVEGRLLH